MAIKTGIIGTGALALGVALGSLVPKDASIDAVNIASEITGISAEAIKDAKSEEKEIALNEMKAGYVKLPKDTTTGKQDSVYKAQETQWTTTVNEDFWINWPDAKRMPLTTVDSWETDTGAVMNKQIFKPSDSLIEACGGIAVQRTISYKCIPLYGVKTR